MLISQWQLIKNVFLKNERTFLRKVVEMVLALKLEGTISKPRILSSYLSKVKHLNNLFANSVQPILVVIKESRCIPSLFSLLISLD